MHGDIVSTHLFHTLVASQRFPSPPPQLKLATPIISQVLWWQHPCTNVSRASGHVYALVQPVLVIQVRTLLDACMQFSMLACNCSTCIGHSGAYTSRYVHALAQPVSVIQSRSFSTSSHLDDRYRLSKCMHASRSVRTWLIVQAKQVYQFPCNNCVNASYKRFQPPHRVQRAILGNQNALR